MNAPLVYSAINAVQRALSASGIGKDQHNKNGNYKFRGIDDVYNALAPLLAAHSLIILPRMLSRTSEDRTSKSGGTLIYVTVEAEFDFISALDGSRATCRTFGEAMDSGDKATNKAMSAAFKYACFQSFSIPTEGDNDADAHSPELGDPHREAKRAALDAVASAVSIGDLQEEFVAAINLARRTKDAQFYADVVAEKDLRKTALTAQLQGEEVTTEESHND